MPDLEEFTAAISPSWTALAASYHNLPTEFQDQFSGMVYTGATSDSYEALVMHSREPEFLGVFLPCIDLAIQKRRALGPQVPLPSRVPLDPLSAEQEAGVRSLIGNFRSELIPAAESACAQTSSLIDSEGARDFGAAVASRCLSDLPEEAQDWVREIGLTECLRLLCAAGFDPSDEDLSRGIASIWVNNESGGYDEYVGRLKFSREPLREDQVSSAWASYAVTGYGVLRPTWKHIAKYYRDRKTTLHARSVLEAMSEGWCLQALRHETIISQVEEAIGQSEGDIPSALFALSEIAQFDGRYEDAYFFSRRLHQHVTSGPGSSGLVPAEIELRTMQCKSKLGWSATPEETNRVNRLLRENLDLRDAKEALAKQLGSEELRRDVLGRLRGAAVNQLRTHFGASWDKLGRETRDHLVDAKSLLMVVEEGGHHGFDLRSAVVMLTAWAVESQLLSTLFHPGVLRQLGWSSTDKPTLNTMLIEWIGIGPKGRFGDERHRLLRSPEKLGELGLRRCLVSIRNFRDRAAHGWPQQDFEDFRRLVFESEELKMILSILTDRR